MCKAKAISKQDWERLQEVHKKAEIFKDEYYNKEHIYCPKCGSKRYSTTLLCNILNTNEIEQYMDTNTCVCSDCGNEHITHDRVRQFKDGKWMYEVLDYYPSNDGSCGYVGSYETEQQAKQHARGGYNRKVTKVYIDYKKLRQKCNVAGNTE